MFYKIILWNFICVFCFTAGENNKSSDVSITERSFNKIFSKCGQNYEAIKCLKVEALKLTNRMIKEPSISIVDGLKIVPSTSDDESVKSKDAVATEAELMSLPSSNLNARLLSSARQFFNTHTIQVDVPRVLSNGLSETKSIIEARGKKYKKYLGPFVAALAIKGGILTMVYHSIAIIAGKLTKSHKIIYYVIYSKLNKMLCLFSGKALIIGKIALIISAIIGKILH